MRRGNTLVIQFTFRHLFPFFLMVFQMLIFWLPVKSFSAHSSKSVPATGEYSQAHFELAHLCQEIQATNTTAAKCQRGFIYKGKALQTVCTTRFRKRRKRRYGEKYLTSNVGAGVTTQLDCRITLFVWIIRMTSNTGVNYHHRRPLFSAYER